ncbi:MAG: 3-hydroxyacyl-CoA dehydrogenase family protein [Chloroflexota bacterium]|nr:MAG: 3-hydroxyacyl-CoA dehydrogenase family protein [Chloroflexota bacterium]
MEIKRIAVLGAGTMGSGIAQVCAESGFDVVLRDISDEFLERGLGYIKTSLGRTVKAGKLAADQVDIVLGRIKPVTSLEEAARDADYVIEAVPEILDLKKETFAELDRIVRPEVVLGSNTSNLSVTAMASATKRPERVCGMHWFNPPQMMRLIEIVKAVQTSDEAIQITRDLSTALGRRSVVCKDSSGFITSRALNAHMLECLRIYEEGLASMEEIDEAIKLALNYPMGPFELADLIGIDVMIHSGKGMEEAFGERMKMPQTLIKMAEAGRYGRKTGKGFYDYTKK